jgi:hypothetical protein
VNLLEPHGLARQSRSGSQTVPVGGHVRRSVAHMGRYVELRVRKVMYWCASRLLNICAPVKSL